MALVPNNLTSFFPGEADPNARVLLGIIQSRRFAREMQSLGGK